MFSNFKKTFINRPQFVSEPPKAVIDAISKELPGDFRYKYSHDGWCYLDTPKGLVLESGNMVLTPEMRAVLPEQPTFEDVKKLMYNSQTTIQIKPNDDGCFGISGERIKAEDMAKAPLKDIDLTNGRFYLEPCPFPDPTVLHIGGDGYELDLLVERIPVNSLYIERFKSLDNLPISIQYSLDLTENNNSFFLTINVTLDKAHSVKEVVEAVHIYNAFMNGRGEIGGQILTPTEIDNADVISNDTVLFWDRVLEVETILGVDFDISKGIDVDAECLIERLYRCLAEQEPYKDYTVYKSVTGEGNIENILNVEEDKAVYIELGTTETYGLLGIKFDIFGIHGLFNTCFDKNNIQFDEKTLKYEIGLKSVKGERMYEGVMLFMSSEAVDTFKEKGNYIQILRDAKELTLIQ